MSVRTGVITGNVWVMKPFCGRGMSLIRDLTGRGPYKARIKLMAQDVPINLILAIQDVGFDYNMTPRQVGNATIAGTQKLWEKTVVFDVDRTTRSPRKK